MRIVFGSRLSEIQEAPGDRAVVHAPLTVSGYGAAHVLYAPVELMVADHDHVYAEASGRLEARRPAREGNKRPGAAKSQVSTHTASSSFHSLLTEGVVD